MMFWMSCISEIPNFTQFYPIRTPGQQLQPAAQNTASNGAHDRIPVLDEIRSPRIAQNAERSSLRGGSEHAADQLVVGDDIGRHQFFRIEHFIQIPMPLDHLRGRRLEIRLGELGLRHEGSEFHVNFGAIRLVVAEGDTRPESKLRHQPGRHSLHGTQCAILDSAPASEDIHGSASELFAQSTSFYRRPPRGDALREPVWTFASLRAHCGLAQMFRNDAG